MEYTVSRRAQNAAQKADSVQPQAAGSAAARSSAAGIVATACHAGRVQRTVEAKNLGRGLSKVVASSWPTSGPASLSQKPVEPLRIYISQGIPLAGKIVV